MQVKHIFTSLLLCAAIGLPQYASAGRFCPVTADGKIRIDECKYSSNEECKAASASNKDCVADQPPASDKGLYCLIMGAFEVCDKYQDFESCDKEAQRRMGTCILNPFYKSPDK